MRYYAATGAIVMGIVAWCLVAALSYDGTGATRGMSTIGEMGPPGRMDVTRKSSRGDAEVRTTQQSSQKGPPGITKLQEIDERFTFEVRYGFFRLGDVHVYLKGDTVYYDTPATHMVTEMISNRSLPIIGDKESHFHNFMAFNDSIPYGLRFWKNSMHRNAMDRYIYDFDYRAGKVYSFEEGEAVDTLDLDRPADSGPAIMYYSRLYAGTDKNVSYPIYIDHEKSQVVMNFTSRQESYDSPAFPDEKIDAYFMSGVAEFEGPFGFSGEFTAYFKDDELRIPLEARVSIWLGSVRVRLVEYERFR